MPDRRNNYNDNAPSQSQYDGTADLINKYSQSLDKSAQSLKIAAQSYEKTSNSAVKDYKSTTNYLVDMMVKTAKAFGKDIDDLESSMKKHNEEKKKQDTESGEKLAGHLEEAYKTGSNSLQRWGKAFANQLNLVGTAIIGRYKTAANSVLSSYESSLSEITVKMFDSNSEYTAAMQKATRDIRDMDLTKQFSQVDFTESLKEVLAQGIRDVGDQQISTSDMALENLITNKLTPYISTSNRTYVRMTKELGKSFTENITGLASLLEDKYGAEALENNQLSTSIEEFIPVIQGFAKEQGLDSNQITNSMMQTMSVVASQYGEAEAENFRSQIVTALQDPTSASALMQSALQGADVGSILNDPMKLAQRYYSGVESYTGMSNYGMYAKALGIDPNTIAYVKGYGEGTSSLDAFNDSAISASESLNAYQNKVSALEGGYGQSKSAQFEKTYENQVAEGVDFLADRFPHALDNLDIATKVIQAWFTAWLAGGGNSGSGLGSVKGFVGKSSLGSQLKMLKGGAGLGETFSAGRAGLSGLGTAAAGASILGGLVWGGYDAYKAVGRAKQSGTSAAGAGVEGFFTGNSTAGMSDEQKKDYYSSNGYFSWSDLAKNAGKYALVGGGVGTFAGGPLGTAVGAVAGGALGAVTSAIDQYLDVRKFKKLQEASEDAAQSIESLKSASNNYETTVKSTNDSLDDLDIITNRSTHTQEEVSSALSDLKSQYPEYLGSIKDVSQLDDSYVQILKDKIELEKIKANKEMVDTAESTSVDTSSYSGIISTTASDFAKWAQSQKSEGDINKGAEGWVSRYAARTGRSVNSVYSDLRSAFGSGVVNQYGNETTGYQYTFDTSLGSTVGNYDYTATLSESDEQMRKLFQDQWTNKIYQEFLNLRTSYLTEKQRGSSADYSTPKKLAVDLSKDLQTFYKGLKGQSLSVYESAYRNQIAEGTEDSPNLDTMFKALGVDIPEYKLGTDKTKEGRAYLHSDEAVLTANAATKMRSMASGIGGISNLVDLMYATNRGLATATTSTSDGSSIESPVLTLLTSYTKSVTDSLSSLVSLVGQLVRPDDNTFPAPKTNRKLSSYQGV